MDKCSNLDLFNLVEKYHQGFSIACVIIGFQNNSLKILLNKFAATDKWMLPGGLLGKSEDVESAAYKHVKSKIGIDNLYLRQFHLFGKLGRTDIEENAKILKGRSVPPERAPWFLDRLITLGYYAFVGYSDVCISPDSEDDTVQWFDLSDLPILYGDHRQVIQKALSTIRMQIGYIPIGYGLLPDRFTMPELRAIYEAIIGRELDRRNFQRKMLSISLIVKLEETKKKGAHKSPILYTFDKEKYDWALENGVQLMDWKIN